VGIPKGLIKCEVCGDYKGEARAGDLNQNSPPSDPEQMIGVSCKCEWILCPKCGVEKMRRPISNYYDEADNQIWHSSFVLGWAGCKTCRENTRQRALEPGTVEPWAIVSARKIRGVTLHYGPLAHAREAFVLLTTNGEEQLIIGTIYFLHGRVIAQPQTPEEKKIIEEVLKTAHSIQGREVALADDPEAWFRSLPAMYNVSSSEKMKVVPKEMS